MEERTSIKSPGENVPRFRSKLRKLIKGSKWSIKGFVLHTKAKWKRHFAVIVSAFLFFFLAAVIAGLYLYFETLNSYVQTIDRSILTTFFTSVGTIIAGILAVIFSFSLFSIQQAAERSTPTVLGTFAKDRVTLWIFVAIALSSVLVFTFSLAPIKQNLTALLILIAVFLFGSTFLLVNIQYRHVTRIINPTYQLNELYSSALKYLAYVDSYVNDMVEIGAIRPSPDREKELAVETSRGLLRAGLYIRLPQFLDQLDLQLREIFDIVHKFAHRQEYEVTDLGLTYAAKILAKLLLVRKDSTVHIPMGGSVGTDLDNFLTNTYERLSGVERVAIRNSDFELAKSVIRAMEFVALASTEIRPISGVYLDENPSTNLTLGYLSEMTTEALNADLFDVGIVAAVALRRIGRASISGGMVTIYTIFSYLKKIAYVGVLKRRSFLVDYPLAGYAEICRSAVEAKYHAIQILMKRALDDVGEIVTVVLPIVENGSMQGTLDVGYYLGSFFDLSKSTAIAYIVPRIVQYANQDNLREQDRQALQSLFFHVNEGLGRFYRDLSEIVGRTESHLLTYIHCNIEMIGDVVFELLPDPRWKDRKKELDDMLSWLLSFYWAAFKAHETIARHYYVQIVDKLSYFGMRAIKEGCDKVVSQCISSLFSVARDFIKKGKNGYGYTPPRIALEAIFIGILAKKLGREEIVEQVVEGLKGFHDDYMSDLVQQQYPSEEVKNKVVSDFEERLLIEMEELRKDLRTNQVHFIEAGKGYLFEEVDEADIIVFENEVKTIIDSEKKRRGQ